MIYLGNLSFNEAYYGDDNMDGSEKDGPTDEDADVDESEEELQKKANEQVPDCVIIYEECCLQLSL